MQLSRHSILLWTPRVLSILFALFLSLFALDVFGEGYGVGRTITAFLIHEIPVIILLLATALAWRWPWVGALAFVGFGAWYVLTAWGQFPVSTYLVIAGPPVLTGLLYLASWFDQSRHS